MILNDKIKNIIANFSSRLVSGFSLNLWIKMPLMILLFCSGVNLSAQTYHYLNNAEYKNGKEKLPYKLKSYKKHKSYKCKKCKLAASTNIKADEQYGMIILSSNMAMEMKKLFRCRRDGIVIEYVGFDQYHCGNPEYDKYNARYNETGSINGYISQPVYRKDIMKVFKKEKKAWKNKQKTKIIELKTNPDGYEKAELKKLKKEKFSMNFFQLGLEMKPKFASAMVNQNVLIIHHKRIHFPKYKPEACGDPNVAVNVPLIEQPLEYEYEFETPKYKRSYTFRNYYARGKTQINDSVFAQIKDSIEGWHIDDIYIESFSSVEGFDTINERYHNERAQNVRTGLKEFYKTEPELHVRSKENWSVFRTQVENSEKYRKWLRYSKPHIKDELTKEEVLKDWDPMLDEQRYSEIKLDVSFEETDTLKFVKHQMENLDDISDNMLHMCHQYLKEHDPFAFQNFKYPKEDRYEYLWYDQINQFILGMNKNNPRHLSELGNQLYYYSKVFNNDILFLNAEIFVIMYGDKIGLRKVYRPGAMDRITDLVEESQYRDPAMQLKVAYYFTYIPKMNPQTEYDKIMKGLEFISDYYYYFNDSVFYDTEQITDIIDFLVQFRTDLALQFLDKYFEELKLFDPYLFSQYLKLNYNHPKHFNDRTYVQTVLDAKEKLTDEQWCDLFIGKCNIDFQLFDDDELRKLYCDTCGDLHFIKQISR